MGGRRGGARPQQATASTILVAEGRAVGVRQAHAGPVGGRACRFSAGSARMKLLPLRIHVRAQLRHGGAGYRYRDASSGWLLGWYSQAQMCCRPPCSAGSAAATAHTNSTAATTKAAHTTAADIVLYMLSELMQHAYRPQALRCTLLQGPTGRMGAPSAAPLRHAHQTSRHCAHALHAHLHTPVRPVRPLQPRSAGAPAATPADACWCTQC